jgi:hypothetical protein
VPRMAVRSRRGGASTFAEVAATRGRHLAGAARCVGSCAGLPFVTPHEIVDDGHCRYRTWVLAILSTVMFGGRLGFHREWRRMVLAAAAGTVILALLYSAALLAAPDPNGQNDHTAGIAVVILSAPTFVAVALMLCLGGAAGHAARWLVSRRKSRQC